MTEGLSPRVKRLIISGLTPSITDQDIRSRFTAFGTVKAVDGVGLLDGNGDPRKFAFVTVEINEQELLKCMSRLNGTKWKGAKLRIGEARPDFNAGTCVSPDNDPKGMRTSSPPEKRQKLSRSHGTGGRHAADMSLTTPENVDSRKHWKRTPLGQLVRPVRMRPDRPIPPLPQMTRSPSRTTSDQPATKRKGSKPLKRAKFTVIDPTRYGSTHLTATTGTFGTEVRVAQDGGGVERTTVGGERERDIWHDRDPEADRTTATSEETSSEDGDAFDEAEILSRHDDHSTIAKRGGPVTEGLLPLSLSADEASLHIRDDKKRDLDILASLLGNQETLAWEPDSDLEELAWENSDKRRNDLEVETDADSSSTEAETTQPEHAPWDVEETPVKAAPLKEMFAPRPDESGFSLFDNIADLDIELEELDVELDPQNLQSHREQEHPEVLNHHPRGSVPDITLDRSAPFFFPLPRNIRGIPDSSFGLPSSRHPSSQAIQDVFDGGTSNSLDSAGFWRVETDDDIRKYWEETKGELTREYKLRHREASRRLKTLKGAIKGTDF